MSLPHPRGRGARTSALLVTGVLLLTGCGATVARHAGDATAPNADEFPITITNCGRQRTYEHPPQRVVTNDIGITELMLALGLEDRMAGYFLSDGQLDAATTGPFRAGFAEVPRLAEDIGEEAVRAAGADMVFAGWNYGFSEADRFTPARLRQAGLESYVLTESCRNGGDGQRGIMPPLRALYTDLRNLGTLFGVADRAEKLIARYRRTVARVHASVPDNRRPPTVFLYDSGTRQPLTSGKSGAAHQVVTKAGGVNVFGGLDDSWTSVTWEAVVRADPDVILVNDYGSRSAREKIGFLTSYPPLSGVDAVENRRFFVLPYASLVESPRNPAAIRAFADYLWPGKVGPGGSTPGAGSPG